MKLLTALLQAHGEWFRLQRCKDRFAGPLGIDALRSPDSAGTGACTPSLKVSGAGPKECC